MVENYVNKELNRLIPLFRRIHIPNRYLQPRTTVVQKIYGY